MKVGFEISLMIFLFLSQGCEKQDDPDIPDLSEAGHPRILLLEGEEAIIRDLINADATWQKMHFAILEKSNEFLSKPLLERKMVGRRLLGTFREALRRIFYLSYAYRMTRDERFLTRAGEEMLAVSRFSDWNPSHFLDVAEMTMGVAIGYDWLFDALKEESKQIIREAIIQKGIEPSFNEDYNWFLNAEHNWNQVCNAGMTYGALAIMEDYPELADSVINRAFETIPNAMHDYQPDGAYPEGYGYWGYGTTFNVMFLSAVEKYYGTDRGLSERPGFLRWNLTTPVGVELVDNGAILTSEGKRMFLKVRGTAGIKMKTWSNQPTTDYNEPNPGTIRVGFECELPADSRHVFEVLLVPEEAEETAEFLYQKLEAW